MKIKNVERLIACAQLVLFYVYPLVAGEPIGMVLIIVSATLLLSLVLGIVSSRKIKFLYPFAASVAFLPTVFLYYNESALVHAIWYLVVAGTGVCAGAVIRAVVCKIAGRKRTEG